MLKTIYNYLFAANTKSAAKIAPPHHTYSFIDAYKKHREPTKRELLAELKNTAYTCVSINAAVCATHPPKLYVLTRSGEPEPKCQTKPVPNGSFWHQINTKSLGCRVEEVVDHPLINLMTQVNEVHNSFDLWELTQTYLETMGCAYWWIEKGAFGQPEQIYPLPAQYVVPHSEPRSQQIVDYYEYHGKDQITRFRPDEIIAFRFPDPRNPYTQGYPPLRAAFEQIALNSEYTAFRRAIYDNVGLPSAIVSPGEVMGPEERDRLESQWNMKFRRGGAGKMLFAESAMKVDILSHSMGDLAALSEAKATKEDICNAFQIPIPFMTGETNLANLQAAKEMHMLLAIRPRLRRRDEKLNERLIPMFDDSGRLFVTSEDPVGQHEKEMVDRQIADINNNIRSINEIRAERGLPPVSWGDGPVPVR
ncbi:MAG: phage portal protein [Gemmataceae bacterium]